MPLTQPETQQQGRHVRTTVVIDRSQSRILKKININPYTAQSNTLDLLLCAMLTDRHGHSTAGGMAQHAVRTFEERHDEGDALPHVDDVKRRPGRNDDCVENRQAAARPHPEAARRQLVPDDALGLPRPGHLVGEQCKQPPPDGKMNICPRAG
jgi:hypothetical protein